MCAWSVVTTARQLARKKMRAGKITKLVTKSARGQQAVILESYSHFEGKTFGHIITIIYSQIVAWSNRDKNAISKAIICIIINNIYFAINLQVIYDFFFCTNIIKPQAFVQLPCQLIF